MLWERMTWPCCASKRNGTLCLGVTYDAENAIKREKQLKKWRRSWLALPRMPVVGGD